MQLGTATALIGSALTLAAAGGCGSAPATIDHTIVEKAIEISIAQQQHVLSIVSCPKAIAARASARFSCGVTFANGSQSSVSVSGTDDRGSVRYSGLAGYVGGRHAPLTGAAR